MSVIGFDVGTKNCIIGVARQGGIETVANEYTQRATPSYVSFGEDQRFLGTSAQQKLVTNIKNTAWLFKHLVGRPYDEALLEKYRKYVAYELVKVPETGRIGCKVQHCSQTHIFSMEQILAMLLGKLRDVAASNLPHVKVSDCVVACPFYLTNAERQAWLDATRIAGLNCLRLMNETAAVALAYGIFKTDLPEPGAEPRRVAFIDIGYTQTQVSVCGFNKGSLNIIAVNGDRNLGGIDLDNLLFEHFCTDFLERYKLDIKSNKRACLRLMNECEKLKKLLSANAAKMQMNVECIMNDKDVTGHMTRSDFEAMMEQNKYTDRFEQILLQTKAQLKEKSIDTIEIIGGTSRVPKFKQIIEKVFGQAPMTTLNADEAVARGAALQCAILSPVFRVRDFTVRDAQPQNIRVDWSGSDGKPGTASLFEVNETVPLSKVLTFTRKDTKPFKIHASYSGEGFMDYPDKNIGCYNIGGIKEPSIIDENSPALRLKVKLRIDGHGQLVVPQAVQIDRQVVEKEPEPEKKEEKKPEEAKPENMENGEAAPKEEENKINEEEKKKNEEKPEEKEKKEEGPSIKTVKLELAVTSDLTGMLNKNILTSYVEMENELAATDKKERDRQDAKNKLEEFVYEYRDKLSGMYSGFAEDSESEAILAQLTKTEDWLYDDGYAEQRSVYLKKLSEHEALIANIKLRYTESETRKPAMDALQTYIVSIEKFLQKWTNKDPSVAHIEAQHIEKVKSQVANTRGWSDQALVKISQLKKSQNPPVLTKDFEQQCRDLKIACDSIMNTPKPAPPKVEEKKEENKETKKDEASGKSEDKQSEKAETQQKPDQMDVD